MLASSEKEFVEARKQEEEDTKQSTCATNAGPNNRVDLYVGVKLVERLVTKPMIKGP